ncbi:uncharacterized protein E0L32_006289 [Thyridium curvatum]|uniref:2EXR domain-containing protein n=1 Tax=Thyridium curvatum TaxID=1093900 RepID=A0A507B2L2_9PEZI|nr:uncharacterized protein E0L32_006289 [Thyridium curvatum]TPX13316.1 hypothetical protein E0L32_006289 [Thyridium curvatum]
MYNLSISFESHDQSSRAPTSQNNRSPRIDTSYMLNMSLSTRPCEPHEMTFSSKLPFLGVGTPATTCPGPEFRLFSKLPQELQDQIWDAALPRREMPRINFGSLREDVHSADSILLLSDKKMFKNAYKSRILNPSALTNESTFRMTCSGSRAAVWRRYGRDRALGCLEGWVPSEDLGFSMTRKGFRDYILAYPDDLFCVGKFGVGSMTFGSFSRDSIHSVMATLGAIVWNIRSTGVREVACEFDTTHVNSLSAHRLDDLAQTLAEYVMGLDIRIWVIDYRLERTSIRPREDRCRFQGDRCRFIEVLRTDTEWTWRGGPASPDVFQVLRAVDVEWRMQATGAVPPISFPRGRVQELLPLLPRRSSPRPEFRILACEVDGCD